MQLGFSAWGMPRLPVEEQIAIVQRAGYGAIELVSGGRSSLDAGTLDGAERRRLREALDRSGLALTSIAAHGDLLEPDAEARAAHRRHVEAGIDLAADIAGPEGPPCVVTMAYGKPDAYDDRREATAEAFGSLAEYAAGRGVTVALEPHVGQAFDLPEKVAWLMERVDSPHFRLNLDNSHFEVMGRDLEDYVPLLVPFSVHTHVKDQRGMSPQHQFLVPGEGDFDYPRYLRAMARAGYVGAVMVEISVMVQRRPEYDPEEVARRSFDVLAGAAERAAVALEMAR